LLDLTFSGLRRNAVYSGGSPWTLFPWLLLVFSEPRRGSGYFPTDFPGVPFWLISECGFLNAVLSTCRLPLAGLLLGLHFDPEDGGSNVLRNADKLLVDYTELHQKTQYSLNSHPFSQYFQFIRV
jgi:hypothetical protein